MKLFKYILWLSLIPSLCIAQDIKDMPSIAYAYPAGARIGSSIDIVIGGRNFKDIEEVIISGEGVKASIEKSILPSERNRATAMRNKLHGILVNRKLVDPNDINKIAVTRNVDLSEHPDLLKMREQIALENLIYQLGQSSQVAFAETLHLKLEVDKNAKLGKRTIKVISKGGVSNSMPFYIDDLPEYTERPIRDISYGIVFNKEAGLIPNTVLKSPQANMYKKQDALIQDITLPVIVNGQIDLLQTDIYRFQAKKGQEIVVFVKARELIYYIGDGVPGWFQAAISVRDSSGKEIAYVDDFFQNPDPLLAFVAPSTDEYTLEIKDAIFRGREDFVYRIAIGQLPFISRIYPLGGSLKNNGLVDIYGFNLDRKQANINQSLKAGYNELILKKNEEKQSKLMYQASSLESVDFSGQDNSSKRKAQEITLHQSANSILKNAGEKHFYEFHTKEDKDVVIEVFARRLGSPIDSYLEIYDSTMELIASNDDFEDFSDGLNTHHADSKIIFKTKANEIYYIALQDTQKKAGQEYAYRLNIYEPKADFEAKASPSTINVVQGKSTPFNVSVFRKNDTKFPIEIRLKDAPEGVSLSGVEIEDSTESVNLVLHCDKSLELGMHNIQLEAVANIDGNEICKGVIPCEDMLQAFYYPHLVPTLSQNIYVISPTLTSQYKDADKVAPVEARAIIIPDEIEIKLGGELDLNIGAYAVQYNKSTKEYPITAELRDSSQGITIEKITTDKYGCVLTLKSNPNVCKIGQSANLVIDVYMSKDKNSKSKGKLKIDTLKAIKYIIIE